MAGKREQYESHNLKLWLKNSKERDLSTKANEFKVTQNVQCVLVCYVHVCECHELSGCVNVSIMCEREGESLIKRMKAT